MAFIEVERHPYPSHDEVSHLGMGGDSIPSQDVKAKPDSDLVAAVEF
jgi:hypothetical protein